LKLPIFFFDFIASSSVSLTAISWIGLFTSLHHPSRSVRLLRCRGVGLHSQSPLETVPSPKMVEFEDEKQNASRVQWTDVDVEAAESRPRPALHRSNSNLSIHSIHSRRGSIDPASALPIQYRTVSFQIAESKDKNAAEIQKAKNNAAKGMQSKFILIANYSPSHRICRS
jgi:hypothetical protein